LPQPSPGVATARAEPTRIAFSTGKLVIDDAADLVGTSATILPELTALGVAGVGVLALVTRRWRGIN
jgi:hypothetical protein